MGICNTIDAKKIYDEEKQERQWGRVRPKKLLLLGSSDSGKSTIYKQLISYYGRGYSKLNRKTFRAHINAQLTSGFRFLIKTCGQRGRIPREKKFVDELNGLLEYVNWHPDLSLVVFEYVGMTTYAKVIEECELIMTPEVAHCVKVLWKDPEIQHVFLQRNTFPLPYDVEYFVSRLDAIMQPDYIPSFEDILRCRLWTSGIFQRPVVVQQEQFCVFDVGGRLCERKKWIHCFEDVFAVIFVTSLSDYDQPLFEDERVNRMEDSLRLFGELLASRWMANTLFFVFFNKSDLFRKKLQHSPFSSCSAFADYKGPDPPQDFDSALNYITNLFLQKDTAPGAHQIYFHVTCALDTDSITHAMRDIKDVAATFVPNGV